MPTLLQQKFQYTPQDLAANREGRISAEQLALMRREVNNLRVFVFAAPALLALVIAVVLAWEPLQNGEGGAVIQVICFVQVPLVFSAVIWRGLRPMVKESVAAPDAPVLRISGPLSQLNRGGPTGISMAIERTFLPITRSQYLALKQLYDADPQQPFTAYYVRGNLRVLAVVAGVDA